MLFRQEGIYYTEEPIKCSIHQVAGLTIGRRALNYKEKIPKTIMKMIYK